MKILLRVLINAVTLLVITRFVQGFEVDSFYFALIAAIVIGLMNAIIRPLLLLLTLPITIITLGLFSFIINAFIVWFASTFLDGFTVAGFVPALFGALILWAVGVLTNWFIKDHKNEA